MPDFMRRMLGLSDGPLQTKVLDMLSDEEQAQYNMMLADQKKAQFHINKAQSLQVNLYSRIQIRLKMFDRPLRINTETQQVELLLRKGDPEWQEPGQK